MCYFCICWFFKSGNTNTAGPICKLYILFIKCKPWLYFKAHRLFKCPYHIYPFRLFLHFICKETVSVYRHMHPVKCEGLSYCKCPCLIIMSFMVSQCFTAPALNFFKPHQSRLCQGLKMTLASVQPWFLTKFSLHKDKWRHLHHDFLRPNFAIN